MRQTLCPIIFFLQELYQRSLAVAALASVRAGCVELIAGQFQNQGHLSVGFIFRISEVKMQADFGSAQNIQHLHGFLQVQNTPIPEKTGSCMQARLYSPRGKFETKWRASKKGKNKLSSLLRTFLAPVLVQIGKLTVNQSKFWLKCRRINQSGNKKELLERYVVIHGTLRLSLHM